MIVSGYTIDMYCDCLSCAETSKNGLVAVGQFVGKNWTDASAQARRAGWRISKDKMICIAPRKSHYHNGECYQRKPLLLTT